ncbi:hypothetical protein K501DRAFT_279508 [Backusella circina FSU 941]|nr:hypothetical protein K501DRAFT_279508 [Backusella circina FSU 941]
MVLCEVKIKEGNSVMLINEYSIIMYWCLKSDYMFMTLRICLMIQSNVFDDSFSLLSIPSHKIVHFPISRPSTMYSVLRLALTKGLPIPENCYNKQSPGELVTTNDFIHYIYADEKELQVIRKTISNLDHELKKRMQYEFNTSSNMNKNLLEQMKKKQKTQGKKQLHELQNQRTVVAYGDANFLRKKGHSPAPVKKTLQVIAQKALVVLINECKTSTTYFTCHKPSDNVRRSEYFKCELKKRTIELSFEALPQLLR